MPDLYREQRLSDSLAAIEQGPGNRFEGYDLVQKVLNDCRALGLHVTDVLQVRGDESAPVPDPVARPAEFTCDVCGKPFKTQMGLFGHQRIHKNALLLPG